MKAFTLLMTLPAGIDFYGTTSDGYLIGLPHNKSEILFLDLRKNATNYTIKLAEKTKNCTVLSKDLLLSAEFQNQVQILWNISDKSSVNFLANMSYSIIGDNQYHGLSDGLVTFNRWSWVFCFIYFPIQKFANSCREFRELSYLRDNWNNVPLTIFKNKWLSTRHSRLFHQNIEFK